MEFDGYLDVISDRFTDRYDVTALFADPRTFDAVVRDFAAPFRETPVGVVGGLDALGFVLGTAVARTLNVGFVPIRKGGKLPIPDADRLQETVTDYSDERKTLEIDSTRVSDGTKVLLVDDWMETAAQMTGATRLVERAGGDVAGISVLDAEVNERSRSLGRAYRVETVNPETNL